MLKIVTLAAISFSAMLFNGYLDRTGSGINPGLLVNTRHDIAPDKSPDSTRLKVGDQCPDIIFRDSARKDVKMSDLRGKYVLIDVWASWCYPCRLQQPHLMLLEEKMKDKAITFLGISVDTQEFRWRGPQLAKMGGTQWMAKDLTFNFAFGVNTIPRYILLDKKGRVVNLNMPLPSHPELEQELLKLKGI